MLEWIPQVSTLDKIKMTCLASRKVVKEDEVVADGGDVCGVSRCGRYPMGKCELGGLGLSYPSCLWLGGLELALRPAFASSG